MKKLLMSLVIASTALTATAPAAAQNYGRDRYQDDRGYERGFDNRQVQQRLHRLSQRISRGSERGAITVGESRRLRAEVQNLWQLAARFQRTGGYDPREAAIIDRRIDRVEQQIRWERRDDDRRYYR